MTQRLRPAAQALRLWGARQWGVAVLAGLATALLLGLTTELAPPEALSRGTAAAWWDGAVWITVSALSGLLVASYVSPVAGGTPLPAEDDVAAATVVRAVESGERRSALLGAVGVLTAWLALLPAWAPGWFAPVHPWLGAPALALSVVAVVHRLAGQMTCPVNLPVSTAKNAVVPPEDPRDQ